MNYNEAARLMSTARDMAKGKPLGANRRLHVRFDGFAICYHDTDIVTIHKDGTYTLHNGGYKTVTTKKWINHYSPAIIRQHKYQWYILPHNDWDKRIPFFEGMKINYQCEVVV